MHSIDLPSLRKPPMRKFECSICHARFVRPTPAYNHMVRVHDIRPEPEVQDLFDLSTLPAEPPDVPEVAPEVGRGSCGRSGAVKWVVESRDRRVTAGFM